MRYKIEDLKKALPPSRFQKMLDENNLTADGKKKNKYGAKVVKESENPYGVKFDSKMEYLFYDLLKRFKIPFHFQVRHQVLPSIKWKEGRAKTKAVHYTPDFFLIEQNVYVELKGSRKNITDASRLRMIMFLHYIKKEELGSDLIIVEKNEVQDFIFLLIEMKKTGLLNLKKYQFAK